ncbi:hypothetical protein C0V97_15065 [Asaia sp. W19]|uniref:hypothetical protein n=1 Tax=unclassified Asaia TaxID=2685023 RepID=UPI000F8EDA74|nr:hypothetical protein [Asaia sp. W19]RUT24616.1 hypothetical protein C0V97_15065 [Asaia sp. W19]
MTDQIETAKGSVRPEARIEEALDRIAYALHHARHAPEQGPDWQPLAANIEALRLRVRDLVARLDDEDEA